MSDGVDVLVRVFVRPVRAVTTSPWGFVAEAVIAVVILGALIEAAATIILIVKILTTLLLAAIALAVTYWLGKRRAAPSGGWRPLTDLTVTEDPAIVAGQQCRICHPIYRPATRAVQGYGARIYICPDHPASASLAAITRGGAR